MQYKQSGMYTFTGKRVQEPPPEYDGPSPEAGVPAILPPSSSSESSTRSDVPPTYDQHVSAAAANSNSNAAVTGPTDAVEEGASASADTVVDVEGVTYTPISQDEIDRRTTNAATSAVSSSSSQSSAPSATAEASVSGESVTRTGDAAGAASTAGVFLSVSVYLSVCLCACVCVCVCVCVRRSPLGAWSIGTWSKVDSIEGLDMSAPHCIVPAIIVRHEVSPTNAL